MWIKDMLDGLRARLAAEPVLVDERARDIVALFDAVKPGTAQDRGLACLIVEIVREVHGMTLEEVIVESAKVAAEIVAEEQTV